MTAYLQIGDYIALVGYFIVVIGIGIWSSCQNRGSVDGYFLARRSMHFIPIGASLFASNIGSGHFIGLAGSGAASGIGTATFEISALSALMILGWIFLPVYIRAGVSTMPEYIKKRFGGDRIQIYLSLLSLILYIFTKISADLFSGALFIKLAMDVDLYFSIGILLILAALFTIGGGATAVIWTGILINYHSLIFRIRSIINFNKDFIQTIFMILGALYLMFASFAKVGGFQSLIDIYGYSASSDTIYSNTTCGLPRKDYFNLIRDAQSDFPWPGMSLGLLISSIWYWCSDQVIVQRALAAKNLTHARAGCIVAGYLKFFPMFLMIFPGMIGRILFPEQVGCSTPESCMTLCGSPSGCSNIAYPELVINLMPQGARGLMLAVMMAALMSSLTSIFNSSSALFTMDIWRRMRPHSKEWELMIVGRVFVIILVAISILWIPIIQASQGSRLFDYIQSITSFLAPPVCAIYVLAIFFKRINEPGAFWGLIIGLICGMVRFIWQFSYEDPPCTKSHLDKRPAVISKVHYLHFGIILFIITCIASWSISLLTKPIPEKYIKRLTYWSINDEEEPKEIPDGTGMCGTCCVGANLDDDDSIIIDMKREREEKLKQKKITKELEKKFKEDHSFSNNYAEPSKLKKAFFWICGIESSLAKSNDDHPIVFNYVDTSIDQDKFWARICDINAIIALAISGFGIAFFNKFD